MTKSQLYGIINIEIERGTQLKLNRPTGQKESKSMTNYSEMKNATAIKNAMRADVADLLNKLLIEKFGEENVSIVGSNEIAVCIGTIPDADGFERELVVTVKPTAKDWVDRKTSKKVFEAYNRIDEAEAYEMELSEKEKAKAEKAKAKEEKIARDKAMREAKKNEE